MPTNVRYAVTRVTVAAESLALVTLDQAKSVLGIEVADTSQDAALQAQIDSVSAAVNAYCGRIFVAQSYRDTLRYLSNWLYPGQPLRTRQFPIVLDSDGLPVLTVSEDGWTVDPAALDIDAAEGAVYRVDGAAGSAAWTGDAMVIDYTAGFAAIPADVQAACLEWLSARWFAAGRDPALRSVSIPDVISEVYAGDSGAGTSAGSMTPGARDLLEPYRIWSA